MAPANDKSHLHLHMPFLPARDDAQRNLVAFLVDARRATDVGAPLLALSAPLTSSFAKFLWLLIRPVCTLLALQVGRLTLDAALGGAVPLARALFRDTRSEFTNQSTSEFKHGKLRLRGNV